MLSSFSKNKQQTKWNRFENHNLPDLINSGLNPQIPAHGTFQRKPSLTAERSPHDIRGGQHPVDYIWQDSGIYSLGKKLIRRADLIYFKGIASSNVEKSQISERLSSVPFCTCFIRFSHFSPPPRYRLHHPPSSVLNLQYSALPR